MASPPTVPSGPDGLTRSDFPVLWPVGTRWADNDMFGHLNNAVYYQLFDTAINAWINTNTGLDYVFLKYDPNNSYYGNPDLRWRFGLKTLVDYVQEPGGKVTYRSERKVVRRVISPANGARLVPPG